MSPGGQNRGSFTSLASFFRSSLKSGVSRESGLIRASAGGKIMPAPHSKGDDGENGVKGTELDVLSHLQYIEARQEMELNLVQECLSGIERIVRIEKVYKRRANKTGIWNSPIYSPDMGAGAAGIGRSSVQPAGNRNLGPSTPWVSSAAPPSSPLNRNNSGGTLAGGSNNGGGGGGGSPLAAGTGGGGYFGGGPGGFLSPLSGLGGRQWRSGLSNNEQLAANEDFRLESRADARSSIPFEPLEDIMDAESSEAVPPGDTRPSRGEQSSAAQSQSQEPEGPVSALSADIVVTDADQRSSRPRSAHVASIIADWVEGAAQTTGVRLPNQRTLSKVIWQGLEDSSSSVWAGLWSSLITGLIFLGVLTSWAELIWSATSLTSNATYVLQIVFAAELLIRYWCCPIRRLFLFNLFNVLDLVISLVMALILILELMSDDDSSREGTFLFSLKIFFPTLLLLKLLRRFRTFHLLLHAFHEALQVLPVLLYTEFVIVLVFAALIYILEPRDNVAELTDSVWFCIVTISTVGYGDISPTTAGGKLISSALITLGGLYMAIPIGIVGNAFSKIWNDRDRLMTILHLRDHISWAGYSREDVRAMFEELDENGDHQLCFEEFQNLLPLMNLDLTENLALKAFQSFDQDGEGTIDFDEFLCGVFPAQRFFGSVPLSKGTELQSEDGEAGNASTSPRNGSQAARSSDARESDSDEPIRSSDPTGPGDFSSGYVSGPLTPPRNFPPYRSGQEQQPPPNQPPALLPAAAFERRAMSPSGSAGASAGPEASEGPPLQPLSPPASPKEPAEDVFELPSTRRGNDSIGGDKVWEGVAATEL